ncbi:hypothetical protein MKW92_040040 [Papaver armeniacum]|nr:hypothetical protein MKW92_040040 [Papaver armeniacum]
MKKTVGSRGVLTGFLVIQLVAFVSLVHFTEAISASPEQFNRSCFPAGFTFGTASSSYQYEGAASKDGRGPSIWDTFTHKFPEKILDGSNGDVAVDSYHRYKEDVKIMQELGLDSYRFSISWSRVLPTGKLTGGVNKEGITYYNNLINELLSKGVQPYVTLFHWDLPKALKMNDFKDYAELCYKEFGDRVKHWITLNEPWTFSNGVMHWEISHLADVQSTLTLTALLASQKGKNWNHISVSLMVPFPMPKVIDMPLALDYMYGWFMDPLTFGRYPLSMQSLVGDRLPKFSKEESDMVKGSFDFIGINYYTGNYAKQVMNANNNINPSYTTDAQAKQTTDRKGVPIGLKSGSPWLHVYPQGIKSLLHYTKRKYKNPLIYITENGISEKNDPTLSLKEALKDDLRIIYYHSHLYQVQRAIKEGVDVKGYFAWSLLDNFEWNAGYTVRFGINFVDYKDGLLKRYPKSSAQWFKKNFLRKPR